MDGSQPLTPPVLPQGGGTDINPGEESIKNQSSPAQLPLLNTFIPRITTVNDNDNNPNGNDQHQSSLINKPPAQSLDAVSVSLTVTETSPTADKASPSISSRYLNENMRFGAMSFLAGFIDTTFFVGLQSLFTGHVTGNLVVAIALVASYGPNQIYRLILIPFFLLGAFIIHSVKILHDIHFPKDQYLGCILFPYLLVCHATLWGLCESLSTKLNAASSIANSTVLIVGCLATFTMGGHMAITAFLMPSKPTSNAMTANIFKLPFFLADILILDWIYRYSSLTQVKAMKTRSKVGHLRYQSAMSGLAILCFSIGCIVAAASERFISWHCLSISFGVALFLTGEEILCCINKAKAKSEGQKT